MASHSLTRQQVREVDHYAIEQLGIPGLVLMENAGRQVADAVVLEFARAKQPGPVVIVAGGGNNGGDGFVCARHMDLRGHPCVTVLLSPADAYTGDAAANLKFLQSLGGEIRELGSGFDMIALDRLLQQAAVVVDAIGGTGVTGPLRNNMAAAVEACNHSGRPIVAVDIPTGLDCDSGIPTGPSCIKAVVTVTFVARKRGFDNPASRRLTGEVVVADIGVPARVAD